MKFTSEDLLKAMGLKVGQTLKFNHGIFKLVVGSKKNIIILQSEHRDIGLGILIDEEYEIIQPKLTLTEDEKVILRNLPDYCNKYIARDINGDLSGCDSKPIREGIIWELREGYRCYLPFEHLFLFINLMECYSIEELLKE